LSSQSTFSARHAIPSAILSADDEGGRPTQELIDLGLQAAHTASRVDLSDLSGRMKAPPFWPEVWPGEHYKLLAAFVQILQPRLVLEIGTATGLSALALKKYLPIGSRVVTFDIVPWRDYPDYVVSNADFADGQLEQVVADLTSFQQARTYANLLRAADLIFIDAAKDGTMEVLLLENFSSIGLKEGACVLFDDIRLLEMIAVWRQIRFPKLDLTSFGHWSGTGLMRWSNSGPWSSCPPQERISRRCSLKIAPPNRLFVSI
jgi:predicted O-methyltransferase YrrM